MNSVVITITLLVTGTTVMITHLLIIRLLMFRNINNQRLIRMNAFLLGYLMSRFVWSSYLCYCILFPDIKYLQTIMMIMYIQIFLLNAHVILVVKSAYIHISRFFCNWLRKIMFIIFLKIWPERIF